MTLREDGSIIINVVHYIDLQDGGVVKEEVILMDPMVPRDTNELREKILFVLDVTIRILIIVCLIVMIAMIIKGKIL